MPAYAIMAITSLPLFKLAVKDSPGIDFITRLVYINYPIIRDKSRTNDFVSIVIPFRDAKSTIFTSNNTKNLIIKGHAMYIRPIQFSFEIRLPIPAVKIYRIKRLKPIDIYNLAHMIATGPHLTREP